jgi:hypothetical protein
VMRVAAQLRLLHSTSVHHTPTVTKEIGAEKWYSRLTPKMVVTLPD